MKNFTIWILATILTLSSVSANYTLSSVDTDNWVKITVNSDFWENKIKEWALQLWYDTSSLEVKNLTNHSVLSTADILTSNEGWITYVWSSNEFSNSKWKVLSFDLVKKENVTSTDYNIELTEGSATLDNWEVSSDTSIISVTINWKNTWTVTKTISDKAKIWNTIVAQGETTVKTGSTTNILILLSILSLLTIGWLILAKNKD